MKNYLLLSLIILTFSGLASSVNAVTWETLDYPGAFLTGIIDIDGGKIIGLRGIYGDGLGYPSFIYDGSWSTLDLAGSLIAVSGSNFVGNYDTGNGFLYDGTSYSSLNFPGASNTYLTDIDGRNIIGDADGHGLIYNLDSQQWTMLDYSGANGTHLKAIDGSNMAGYFRDSENINHHFVYDGSNWTLLDLPGFITGISGDNIVGRYLDASGVHGYLYNGTSWITLDFPGANNTEVWGIDGDKIVGQYSDSTGKHGFIATIPEPCTILLLGLGGLLVRRRTKRVARR